MTSTFFKGTLFSLFLVVSNLANAGLITDTTNDSFVDNTTGLEWMDFGINNQYTYAEVESLLTTEYKGWSIANESQVLDLLLNAFGGGQVVDTTGNSQYDLAYLSTTNGFDDIFDVMKLPQSSTNVGDAWYALFDSIDGDIGGAEFINYNTSDKLDVVVIINLSPFVDYRTLDISQAGTMLVKNSVLNNATSVPEPSTLFILTIGLAGLVSRRLKRA